jgi:hypothetical protein
MDTTHVMGDAVRCCWAMERGIDEIEREGEEINPREQQ